MAFVYDSTVISYTVSIITDGILMERNCTGPLCPPDIGMRLLYLKPGSKVIYDNRKRRAPNGGTIRLPDKMFVIRK
jgi:hypothetical protein